MSSSTAISPKIEAEITLTVERLQFATLLNERKKAMDALQLLAQKLHMVQAPTCHVTATIEEQEFGNIAVPAVLTALVSDPRDTELMEVMLEFLQLLVSRAPSAALLLLEQPPEHGTVTSGMETCLMLLQDPSPWIRGPAVGLLKVLQDVQPSAFATSVLECKEGLRRLLEVVEDRREHIRDTALAVLGQLTRRDKNAQQFLAFEEGFARLFQIMEVEGLMESGVNLTSNVVGDCLETINNMLRDNLMTQTLFLEMSYLESHVPQLLRLSGMKDNRDTDMVVVERRKRVLTLGLQLVRFLVAELYDGANKASLDAIAQRDCTRKSQDLARIQSLVARQEALMGAVGELVCCRSEVLTDIRLEALDLLRLVSEHNGGVQMIVMNLYTSPSGRNVLAELVSLDVGIENVESAVAAKASTLLDTLFQENEGARMAVLQHIQTPPPRPITSSEEDAVSGYESSSVPFSAGRVLLDAFVVNSDLITQCTTSHDINALNSKLIIAWKASHRLTRLLVDSSYCKELALRVPAQYGDSQARGVAGGLFLSRCIRMLQTRLDEELSGAAQSIVFQTKLSVLLLLIRWCHDCPKAVQEIAGSVTNLSVLVNILTIKPSSTSSRSIAETTQLQGLVALLLGCCLEYLCEDEREQQALVAANIAVPAAAPEEKPGIRMTRDQFLQLISKRIGLERFTDAMVQFQQTPAMLACAQASPTQSSRSLLAYRATYDTIDTDATVGGPITDDKAHYLFMLYERGFTIFYRKMAEQIQKRVVAIYTGVDSASTGVDSGTLTSLGAYQDLIRMQDKQIHDLQCQMEKLKQLTIEQGSQEREIPITNASPDEAMLEQLAAQRKQFEREKADMESQIKSMSESALEMDTRMNALTLAYEQLEAQHEQKDQELTTTHSDAECVQSSSVPYDSLQLQLITLRAELDVEREASRQLRCETVVSSTDVAATHVFRDESKAELANAQLVEQLEALRVESKRKDEELAEYKQLRETLTEDLVRIKRDNERLKEQLAEALSNKAGQGDEIKFEAIVDGLIDDKARLEVRVKELEAAACAAYEEDQEVLRQRIEQVEQARRACPPPLLEVMSPNKEMACTEAPSTEQPKELRSCQSDDRTYQVDNGKLLKANGSSGRFHDSNYSTERTLDDLLVLVASLEIQCSVFRKSLKEAQGEDAVAVAIELSRQRGAVISI